MGVISGNLKLTDRLNKHIMLSCYVSFTTYDRDSGRSGVCRSELVLEQFRFRLQSTSLCRIMETFQPGDLVNQ
jgi:hypothetical protein